jgi:hypothetical protein
MLVPVTKGNEAEDRDCRVGPGHNGQWTESRHPGVAERHCCVGWRGGWDNITICSILSGQRCMLDRPGVGAHIQFARQLGGRCRRGNPAGGGKSGLHGNTVPVNGRRGRPQGKCHRKQTAGARQLPRARVKRCGKSAPRPRQRGRQGKPHREQDRIGAAGGRSGAKSHAEDAGTFPSRRPGWSREARSDARPRGMVVPGRKVWTEPGLQAVWHR